LKLKWRRSSPDRKIGLEKEEEAAVNKNGKRRGREQSTERQPQLPLRGLARKALWDTVMISGLAFVEDELEVERVALCGQRYEHQAGRQALRSGHVPSSLVLGGRRVKVERPRARSIDGHELSLPSWRAWSSRDPLEERAFEHLVVESWFLAWMSAEPTQRVARRLCRRYATLVS
jgi:hypothetical protein